VLVVVDGTWELKVIGEDHTPSISPLTERLNSEQLVVKNTTLFCYATYESKGRAL